MTPQQFIDKHGYLPYIYKETGYYRINGYWVNGLSVSIEYGDTIDELLGKVDKHHN